MILNGKELSGSIWRAEVSVQLPNLDTMDNKAFLYQHRKEAKVGFNATFWMHWTFQILRCMAGQEIMIARSE